MRTLGAIVMLTLRAALRERVAWSMLALTAGTLVLLPAGLRGDGTLAGELQMQIRYSTGISAALLAGLTLWVSCAAVSGDLSSKRLQMVLTKPVSRGTLWWGKWLAVTALSVSLLLLCGAVTWVQVESRVRGAGVTAAEREAVRSTILTARRPERPVVEDLTEEVEAMIAERRAAGMIPEGMEEDLVFREIYLFALTMRNAARAGETVRWEIPLSAPVAAGEVLQLAYVFDGASMGANRVPGRWRVGRTDGGEAVLFEAGIEQSPAGERVIPMPVSEAWAGAERLWVEFVHEGEGEGQMVFFRRENGVGIYRTVGGFGGNLFRGLGLLAGLLALLAALGVSAGSLFSLPVACYATAMILVVRLFSGTLEEVLEKGTTLDELKEHGAVMRVLDRGMMGLYRGMDAVIRPLDVDQPLERVSRGVLVPGGELLRTGGLRMVPGLVVISLAGIGLFRQREVGVAE